MVGLSLPMVLFAGGAAVDTGYAVMLRGELTQITRLACTRLSTSAADFATAARQSDVTTTVIDALLTESRLDRDQTQFTFSPAVGGSANVQAQSIYRTNFLQIFGIDQVGLAANEVCAFELRLPTARPTTSCDVTVPSRPVNASLSLTLDDARQEWRDYNEGCVVTPVPIGGYRDATGTWITNYDDEINCTVPPLPDEMIATVLTDSQPVQVAARVLLSEDASRGQTQISYDDLPAGELALQPVNGFPVSFPQACEPVPAPPVAPPTIPTSAPTVPPSSPDGGPSNPETCQSGSASARTGITARVSPGGTINTSSTSSVTDACGNETTVRSDTNLRDGEISNETRTTRNGNTEVTRATGSGNGIESGTIIDSRGPRTWIYGPNGGLDVSRVSGWF